MPDYNVSIVIITTNKKLLSNTIKITIIICILVSGGLRRPDHPVQERGGVIFQGIRLISLVVRKPALKTHSIIINCWQAIFPGLGRSTTQS